MSEVYLGVRSNDEYRQRVAVKILRQGVGPDAGLRLRRERQILAALDHPHIARFLFGDTTEDGVPFFAMEYVDGLRIDEFCHQHRLSVDQRLDLFLRICSAVEYAHRNLVVHRDLKPGNILVTGDGHPKLLDFGIAKLLNPDLLEPDAAPTVKWLRRLTPSYASPEQVRGEPMTTATDIYSLGVLLYELLTGALPLQLWGLSTAEAERAVLESEPKRPSAVVQAEAASSDPSADSGRDLRDLRRRLTGDLDHILLKALRKEPARRYSSVERFAEDLQRHLRGEPVQARKGTLAYRGGRFLRRHRWQVSALLAFFFLTVLFAVTMASQARKIRQQARQITVERDEARREAEKRERVLSFMEELFHEVGEVEGRGGEVRVAEMIDLGVGMVDQSNGDEAEIRAALLGALGRNYEQLRRYEKAEGVHKRALALRLREVGTQSLETARSYRDLGSVNYNLGRYPEAERLARKAVAIFRKASSEPSLELAGVITNLATALYDQHRYEEAETLYRESLEIRRNLPGERHREVVQNLNYLGLILANVGRFDEAQIHLRQALRIQLSDPAADPWTLAYSMNNLAFLLLERGDLETAEPLFREALEIWRPILDPDNPQLGFALQGLGRLYLRSGKPAAAEEAFRELLSLVQRGRPEGHWTRAQAAGLLGAALASQNRFQAAEPLLSESLRVLTEARGAEHRDTRFAREQLSALYRKTGREELAASLSTPEAPSRR